MDDQSMPTFSSTPARTDPLATQKIDPVAVNGPVFEDWPKPKLLLFFTGEQNGYLEPCGCAGLENGLG